MSYIIAEAQNTTLSKSAKILIVDDNEANCKLLEAMVTSLGHTPIVACNGYAALEYIQSEQLDMILLDVCMPKMNGYEVLENIKNDNTLRNIPVIMISALDEISSIVTCILKGADDYLVKPFNFTLLKARIVSCLEKKYLRDQEENYRRIITNYNHELELQVKAKVTEIISAQWATIFAMAKLAESRDPETGEHLGRMKEYSKIICQKMKNNQKYVKTIDEQFIENIYGAALLHDIGKVGIPDNILLKKGKLTVEEFEIMKTHTTLGAKTLREVERKNPGNCFLRIGIEIAEGHHEKWNGTGYPFGLAEENIPLPARIVALADVFDALTSKRIYKESFSYDKSKKIITKLSGTHFDPDIVDAFICSENEFVRIINNTVDLK